MDTEMRDRSLGGLDSNLLRMSRFIVPEVESVLRHGKRFGDGRLHLVDRLRGADHLVLAVFQGTDEAGVRLQVEVVLRADLELPLDDFERAGCIFRH